MNCEKIKPCPFCGNKNGGSHLSAVPNLPGGKKLNREHFHVDFHVVCTGCAAMGPLSEEPQRAIDWWNEVSDPTDEFH